MHPTSTRHDFRHRGILAPATRLDRWLMVVLLVLLLTGSARYVDRHGLGVPGTSVLIGAVVLGVAYSARGLLPDRTWWPTAWVLGMVLLWGVLTGVAPSFAWCAVPVAFAVLRVLPFRAAVVVVLAMTLLVTVAWVRITDDVDPMQLSGPISVALVTVLAYRALDLESRAREAMLDQLLEAQSDLAEEQRRTGALAERSRLSRDLHDSVGQGFSSINLLLQAAEQAWDAYPDTARVHVGTAAAAAREGLEEVRRVVRDLSPESFVGDGSSLRASLRRAAAQTLPGTEVEVRVDGAENDVPAELATALVHTTRGALANVREHAGAQRVAVTLTYHPDSVMLDIRDDGCGFDPDQVRLAGGRGRGLAGIRERASALGGDALVESGPGQGTTISVRFPVRTEQVTP